MSFGLGLSLPEVMIRISKNTADPVFETVDVSDFAGLDVFDITTIDGIDVSDFNYITGWCDNWQISGAGTGIGIMLQLSVATVVFVLDADYELNNPGGGDSATLGMRLGATSADALFWLTDTNVATRTLMQTQNTVAATSGFLVSDGVVDALRFQITKSSGTPLFSTGLLYLTGYR